MNRQEARQLAEPILARLSRRWRFEDEAVCGIRYPNIRLFWAEELGLVERKRAIFSRRWKIRLI